MTPDDLDRILASEEPLVPSSGFVASVMEHLGEDGTEPLPLPFPWRRFLLGFAVSLALSGLLGSALAGLPWREALANPYLLPALGKALVALAGTYLVARLALDSTEARR